MTDEMIFDPRMRELVERLVAGARHHPQVRSGLDVQDVEAICDAAKQLAVLARRRWVTPTDIKTAFRSIARGKLHCIDDAPNEPVIEPRARLHRGTVIGIGPGGDALATRAR